jgi:hypothetical protein
VRSKQERFEEFLSRLASLPPARDAAEARRQIEQTLNEVENEMTNIPYNPDEWRSDGRMYPPQDDSIRRTSNREIMCFRSKGHRIFIGSRGAIEIQEISKKTVFSKPGADGKTIRELLEQEEW